PGRRSQEGSGRHDSAAGPLSATDSLAGAGSLTSAATAVHTPAAAPAPSAPTAPLAPHELAAPLMKLRTHGDGDHEMTLMLHPADLGPVNVHVRLTGTEMSIQLASTNDSARAALRDALPQLHAELQQAGLSSSIDLTMDLGSSSANPQPGSARSQQQPPTGGADPISSTGNLPNGTRESRSIGSANGLDRWL
ncbi:MAG TPA: flagellar hook-length control protein FliK, partial [Jatrophihabitans sp.]|nr:flagellar hook-length control protein FliK [Jatrophihabitans sp.]